MDFEVDGVFFKQSKITAATTKRYANQEDKYGDAYRAWWSCESRVNDMDKYGWDIQVCLPTAGHVGAQMSRTDAKLGAAVVRAYNNWARDYCGESPDRGEVRFRRARRRRCGGGRGSPAFGGGTGRGLVHHLPRHP